MRFELQAFFICAPCNAFYIVLITCLTLSDLISQFCAPKSIRIALRSSGFTAMQTISDKSFILSISVVY